MAEKRLVELKARCPDLESIRARLLPAAQLETILVQRDTYFEVPRGRLKLREVSDRSAQLILYDRPDIAAVKGSRIQLAEVPDGAALGGTAGGRLRDPGPCREAARDLAVGGRTCGISHPFGQLFPTSG